MNRLSLLLLSALLASVTASFVFQSQTVTKASKANAADADAAHQPKLSMQKRTTKPIVSVSGGRATPTTTSIGSAASAALSFGDDASFDGTAAAQLSSSRDVSTKLPGPFWRGSKSKYVLDFDWAVKKGMGFRQRLSGGLKFFLGGGLIDFFKTIYALYFRSVPTTIYDAREFEKQSGLSKADFFDKYGFVLVNAKSDMTAEGWEESDRNLNELLGAVNANDGGKKKKEIMNDFRNGDTPVKRIYAKEAENIIKNVVLTNHQTNNDGVTVMPPARGIRRYITKNPNKAPARQVHNDYGLNFDDVVDRNPFFDFESQKAKYEETKSNEYMLVNLWRPIKPMSTPLRSQPLCFLDASTLSKDDFVSIDSLSLGVITSLKENPNHKFYYYPDMTVDEVVVFKQFHKVRNETLARMPVFHTAFADPAADKNTEGRVSFEYRVGVLA